MAHIGRVLLLDAFLSLGSALVECCWSERRILHNQECNGEEDGPDEGRDLTHRDDESQESAQSGQLDLLGFVLIHQKVATAMSISVDFIECRKGEGLLSHFVAWSTPVKEHHREHIVDVKHAEDWSQHDGG